MGKLQEFEITLKDNKVVYSPGESISGTVKITTAQHIQCKAIKVNCQGYCGVTNKANDMAWSEEEQYSSSTLSVADKGTLKQGEHTFPFKFLLPATAPTSYEGPYGRIMYRIRAFIDTPRFAKDYRTEKPFYMLNNFDLNEVPDIHEPNLSSVSKNFSYMLVKNGTVLLQAKSDLRGYTPGQVIKVSAEIDNSQSGKSTGHVVASLMQKVTYGSKRQTNDLRTIAEVEGAGVKGGKKAEWNEQIIVPPLPQSSLAGCNLIKIKYFIQVSLKYPEMLLTLPIHIGNTAIDPSRQPPPRPRPAPRAAASPSPSPGSPKNPPTPRPASTSTPPQPAPKPAPRPRPRSAYLTPSAPPPEPDMLDAGGRQSEEIPTKVHSQQQGAGPEASVSPSGFSYAPGLSFAQNHRTNNSNANASAPLFCVSTGATIPFFTEGNAEPVPTTCPLVLPPDYRSSSYPHEPPPSYEDSCTNT